jgi:diguanylate cyclase (GGDEF)-like protein
MRETDRSHAAEGSLSDRLVRRLTDPRFRLGTWSGILVGAAGSLAVTLADRALDPGVSLVMPLALVVVVVAWLSPPLASVAVILLASGAASVQNIAGRGVPFTSAVLAVDIMRLASLAVLAFMSFQLRKALMFARTSAVHDQLTGVLNRRGFFELAEREIARSQREGTPFTIAVMDLNRFKQINDAFGHHVGDATLERFAGHATARLRKIDVFGRTGGDEFCLVLPLGPDEAGAVVKQLIDVPPEDGQPELTISAGVVSYAHAPASLHAALIAADKRMYCAKRLCLGLDIEVVPD